MSFLRRRLLGQSTRGVSHDATAEKGGEVRLVPVSKLKKLSTGHKSKRRNGFVFGLGGLFGLIVAAFFANQHDVISFEGIMDLNLESVFDVIPAGIIRDAKEITVDMTRIICSQERQMLKLTKSFAIRNMSVMRSNTIHLPWACIFNRKGSKLYIQSS